MDAELHEQLYQRILKGCTPFADGDVAITAKLDLIPTGGFDLNKLMPPTYKEDKQSIHHFENRFLTTADKENVEIVVLDQPQSTANRIEKVALMAQTCNKINLSDVSVEVEAVKKTLSAMETNHRVFSAIHQSATLDGVPFIETELGKVLYGEDLPKAMRAVVEYNVLAMVLGCWASHTGSNWTLKFPRILFNEVIAGVSSKTKKSASCSDPIGILDVVNIEVQDSKNKPWRISGDSKGKENSDKGKKKNGEWKIAKPSEVGLGNATVPNLSQGGVSVSWIKDIFILSLQRSHRYETGNFEEDCNVRAMLACLGLYLYLLKTGNYDLRSGCDLRRKSKATVFNFEIYDTVEPIEISLETAEKMYFRSLEPLKGVLDFKKLVLKANKDVEILTHQSRQ